MALRWKRHVTCPTAVLFLCLAVPAAARAPMHREDVRDRIHGSRAITGTFDNQRRIDVNQINMWVMNDGTFGFSGPSSVALLGGLIYPKGTPKNLVFGSGLWLGAKVAGEVRTAVGFYAIEYAPGTMIGGQPDNPGKPEYRTYKIARFSGDPSDTMRVDRPSEELAGDPVLDPLLHDAWSDYMAGAVPHGAPTRTYRLPVTTTPDPTDSVDVLGPDVLGDQMLWSVYNDADPAPHQNGQYKTAPLGVEVQQATFGFNRQGALGNTVFLKYTIINKGTNQLDSLYVSLWSDPDLGDLGDDLVGCDTTLSLGYCYNANNNDAVYGSRSPAVGYDFFLGPRDTATGDTLGLASFNKFISGTDPLSADEVYNYMRGLNRDGSIVRDPTTGVETPFFVPGDPIQGTGWLDTNPADRRFLMSAGPFAMAPGDTQVVVGAIVVGEGSDRLSSISALKFFDLSAQDAFDRNFDLPSPPSAPKVSVAADHGKVRLCWDAASRTSYGQSGYGFEGYNVYQGASAVGPWKRVATYDEINSVRVVFDQVFDLSTGQLIPEYPVAFGSDNGIAFCHIVTEDAHRGGALRDGTEYYFAVTAYSYGPGERPRVLETAQQVIRATPQRPPAGTQLSTASAAPVEYTRADPGQLPTTDQLVIEVVNPAEVTGHTYRVSFQPLVPPFFGQVGSDTATVQSSWSVEDVTTGEALIAGELNRRGDDDYRVFHGLRAKLLGSYFPLLRDAFYVNNVEAHDVALWGADDLPFLFGGAGAAGDFADVTTSLHPSADPDSFVPVEIRFDSGATQRAYRFLRQEVYDTTGVCISGDPPPAGVGYLYRGFHTVPFTVWDVSRNRQLDAVFVERQRTDCAGVVLPDSEQPATQDSTWGPGIIDDPGNEYLFVATSEYSDTPKPSIMRDGALLDSSLPLMYALVTGLNPFDPVIDDGDAFRFDWAIPASPNDTMRFDTRALVRGDAAIARQRLDRIRVVPNPYYNQSRYELTAASRILRFINMPELATVRIFNLAGHLTRTLRKTDPTVSVLEWDLKTENGLPVGSGIYIYHIDVPGVGSTFGRMAIFMESERLTNF